jgi:hypothetical protein
MGEIFTKDVSMEKPENSLEPKCECGGYLFRKIGNDAKYPYQCAKCGREYQTPPPTIRDNSKDNDFGFIELLRKIFGIGGGE